MTVRQLAVASAGAAAITTGLLLAFKPNGSLSNLGAELAGVFLSVTIALLAVDKVAADQRRARYRDLRWATGERALDLIEECSAGFIHDLRKLDPEKENSFHFWFRAEADEDDPDLDSAWWRARNDEELEWRIAELREAEQFCRERDPEISYPVQALRSRSAVAKRNFARLERLGDRLAAMTAGEESDVSFLRWIWRAADKRHDVFDTALDEEISYDDLVWREVRATLYALRRAYESGRETRPTLHNPKTPEEQKQTQ